MKNAIDRIETTLKEIEILTTQIQKLNQNVGENIKLIEKSIKENQ